MAQSLAEIAPAYRWAATVAAQSLEIKQDYRKIRSWL